MCMIRIDKHTVQGELAQLMAQIEATGQEHREETAAAVRDRIIGMRALFGGADFVGEDYKQHRDILRLLDEAAEHANAVACARPSASRWHLHA